MASVDISIAGRTYSVSCRDGEEPHLRSLAATVDRKAQEAATALGNLSESRQLLFASLLLADEIKERQRGNAPEPEPEEDPAVADALERLADRVESLAQRLETKADNA
jgi:cell division protein ZapA